MGTGVVGLGGTTALYIHASHKLCLGIVGDALQQVNGNTVLLLGVEHADGLLVVYEHTGIAYLTAHLAIERSLVEDSLVDNTLLLLHLAVLDDAAAVLCVVVSYEGAEFLAGKFLGLANDVPVAHLHLSSVAGTSLLLLHLGIETSLVHGHAVFAADKFGQVQGETEGIKQGECLLASDLCIASGTSLLDNTVEQTDTILQSAQETVLLLLHNLHDEILLSYEFGEGTAHLLCQSGNEGVHECLLLTQEGIAVAHCTAQDAADNVTSLGIGGQLTVGNAEGDGTQVVDDNTHGDVGLLALAVGDACLLSQGLDDGLEDVCVVVRLLALDGTHQTLEAHTGIDYIHAKGFEMAVGLAFELHEHDVPYLDDLWVVLVDKFTSGHLCLLLGRTAVQMNLGTGATRTCIAHFPEVVVLVAIDDVIGRDMLEPEACCLVIA